MTDLECVLRERLALLPEPELTAPAGLAARLRRRHDRRRLAAPVGVAATATGVTALVLIRPGVAPATLSPASTPTAGPSPSAATRSLLVAGLTFTLPAELHVSAPVQGISQDVTRHDNSTADGGPSYGTDVGLDDGRRSLSITVYDGRAAASEWEVYLGEGQRGVLVAGLQGREATTVSLIPPGVSKEMAQELSRPSPLLLVRVSSDRTLLLTGRGFTESELVAIAESALHPTR